MTDASATAVRDARLAWIIGGSLFIGYAILLFAAGAAPGLPLAGFQVLVGLTWAAGLFVFAFGIRRSGSVVGRRPVGVVAMVVAGAMPLLTTVMWQGIPVAAVETSALIMLDQATAVLLLAALLVATVTIARAGVVPSRVRWLPLILFASVSAIQILTGQVFAVLPYSLQEVTVLFYPVATLLRPLSMLVVGILAIVLAPREVPAEPLDRTVPVYGPPPAE